MLAAQLGQLVAIAATGSLLAVTTAFAAAQGLTTVYVLAIDAPRLFPYLRKGRAKHAWRWIAASFALLLRLRWRALQSWRCSTCRCCRSVLL
jgi:hypothetical protein